MTLAKKIETAREALEAAHKAMNDYLNGEHWDEKTGMTATYFSNPTALCENILAALPDKPKSEDDLIEIGFQAINAYDSKVHGFRDSDISEDHAKAVIRALKAANVLYVRED